MALSAAVSLLEPSTAFADSTPSGRLHDFASCFQNDNIGATGRGSGSSNEVRLSGTPPYGTARTSGSVSRTASENVSPQLATCHEDARQSHPDNGATLAAQRTVGAVTSLGLHSSTEGEFGDGGAASALNSPNPAGSGPAGSGSSQPPSTVAESVAAAVAGWMSVNATSTGTAGSRVPPVTLARAPPPLPSPCRPVVELRTSTTREPLDRNL
jgi:hypothetical protein